MSKNKLKNISKFLSLILRHKPETINLKLDEYGWADIDELIEKSMDISLTKELIAEVVAKSDKKRFIIEGNKIRANQGHSIEVDLELKPLTPPDILYHGTATRFLDSIIPNYAIGLLKLVIVLVLWVFVKNLSLTQRLSDDFLQMSTAQ